MLAAHNYLSLCMQEVLSNSKLDIRLHKKSLFLIADLADGQLENENTAAVPFFSNRLLLKAVVDSMASSDLDLQEKVCVVFDVNEH